MMGTDDMEIRGGTSRGLRCLTRRKQVDSERTEGKEGQGQLAKALSIPGLLAIGVGATIGAGVYVLVGTVARDHTGPALTISFLIAGISAALSALCYAELASRCPSAGSAYHYSYICVGEGVAWIIGWALILEYAIGGSAVARGISPNLALFFGGPDSLPAFLARVKIPWIGIVVDPCAAILVLVVTMLLSVGIKESSLVQGIVTAVNVCVMIFVIILGTYLGFKSGWPGYRMTENGYFPFGINGVIAGSATVFFSFIGFDSIASAAEEVKEPQRDLPLGIGLSLSICCGLYMLVSAVIVGIVPYLDMDPDTPISSAFSSLGVEWAMYLVSAGAFTALCATLLGSLLPQPRILMAMARDGLLPPFFSDVNNKTQVPVKGTIASGVCAAILAFLMNVEELAGMVSVGTLLAFTIVAISILILRYIPPDEVPLPSSLQESIHSVASLYNSEQDLVVNQEHTLDAENAEDPQSIPLISNKNKDREQRRRKVATISIAYACAGSLILTSTLSLQHLPHSVQTPLYIGGGLLILGSLVALYAIDQDDNRHNFGHSGGFTCPFVPLLPVCCILINVYLLINLGASTWWKVALWLALGIVIYVFYGRKHSQLVDAVYVPSSQVEEIYRTSLET